jgi:hypothetical protein
MRPLVNMRVLILILTIAAVLGCSNHWREGDTGRTPDEVAQFLSEVQSAQGQSLVSGDVSGALQYSNESVIYFGEAPGIASGTPGPLGYVSNLLSFDDFSWLGSNGQTISWSTIQDARVFFLDHASSGGSDVGLVIGLNLGSGYTYFGFSGRGSVQGGEFVATLSGGNGQIVVRSWDNDGNVLNDVIQLKVYQANSGGEEYLGKISTLVGYQ